MTYDNIRGFAERNKQKSIRVGTHLDVLKECFSNLKIKHIIEHGMGASSTPFFHNQKPLTFLSYENKQKWQNCPECKNQTVEHMIKTFSETICEEDIKNSKIDLTQTIVFIDGDGLERDLIFKIATNHGVMFIVEHDAEAFTKEMISIRLSSKNKGYECFQYVSCNPETAIYCKQVPQFVLDKPDVYVKL